MLVGGDPEFVEEMVLEPAGEGRFHGELTNNFCAPVLPQGGITTGLALRAADLVLGRPDQHVRLCHTTFAGMVPAGPVDVEVQVIREGRAASQVLSHVRRRGSDDAGHVVLATFGAGTDGGFEFVNSVAPDAPPPEQCVDRWEEAADHPEFDHGVRPTFFEHFEGRHVNQKMPWERDWEPDGEPVISWMRWKDTPVDGDGETSPLAIVPPIDTLPSAVFQTRGPGGSFEAFLVPSADLYVHVYDTRLGDDGWMLRRNSSRWASGGLAQADVEVFSSDGRLLAHANQLMHVRPVQMDAVRDRIRATREPSPSSPPQP